MDTINFKNLDPALSYAGFKKAVNVSYLGGVSTSHKLELSENAGVLTYGVYLAPWNMSGYQVCAGGAHCHEFCLNGSGQNKADELAHGREYSKINQSRIKKTRLFYQNRPLFMRVLIREISRAYMRAQSAGMPFAIRINCTSDLNLELFIDPDTGKNILDLFSFIQFYDYTKVAGRAKLVGKYDNYDITFSYDGYNWNIAEKFLEAGGRVAVVFDNNGPLPSTFCGYKVINGNNYDMRYLDPAGCIVGLSYHPVANDYKIINGKRTYVSPDTPFVVKLDDPRVNI